MYSFALQFGPRLDLGCEQRSVVLALSQQHPVVELFSLASSVAGTQPGIGFVAASVGRASSRGKARPAVDTGHTRATAASTGYCHSGVS